MLLIVLSHNFAGERGIDTANTVILINCEGPRRHRAYDKIAKPVSVIALIGSPVIVQVLPHLFLGFH